VFIIVVSTNLLSIANLLLNPNIRQDGGLRHATITVAILSVLYCFFNVGFLIYLGQISFSPHGGFRIPDEFHQLVVFILLPLNSASNPLVYFTRKVQMRTYLRELWGKLIGVCTSRSKFQESQPKERRCKFSP
jgi:hypothetical protein